MRKSQTRAMSAVIVAAVLAALGFAQAVVSRLQGTTLFAAFIQAGGEQNRIGVGGREASSSRLLHMENPFLARGSATGYWATTANGENDHRGFESIEQSQLIVCLA